MSDVSFEQAKEILQTMNPNDRLAILSFIVDSVIPDRRKEITLLFGGADSKERFLRLDGDNDGHQIGESSLVVGPLKYWE